MTETDEITVENVLANPSKYGFPTFQEFARKPAQWRDTLDDKLARFDGSSKLFKNLVEKQTYKISGYEVDTLEQVEHIAKNEGIDLNGCKFCPQVLPQGNGKCRIVVEFKRQGMSRILDFMGRPFRKKLG